MECNIKSIFFFYLIIPCLSSFFLGMIFSLFIKVIKENKNKIEYINIRNNSNDGRTILRFKD
jgi:hypothetical protein